MNQKDKMILEYASLAAKQVMDNQPPNERMKEIEDSLQMTSDAIMKHATQLAVATMK